MSNSSILLISGIAVIAIAGGLTLLIIGLVQNKLKFWIPGLIVFVIALIIGLTSAIFSFKNIITTFSHNVGKHRIHGYLDSINTIFSNTKFDINSPVDSTFSNQVSGFVHDTDNSLIYIKVFPKKNLADKGVTIEKVNKGKTPGKSISLILDFDKEFVGNIKLTAFDYLKKELGSSIFKANKKEDEISNINFTFPDNIKFSSIDYCTLTEAE
jgi:hypothetical protein